MHDTDPDVWTPKKVGKVLIQAVRWARYNAGPTGPAQVRSLMPAYTPTALDRLVEGWDDAPADANEEKVYRRPLTPQQVQRLIDALYWPAKYAVPELPTSARVLNLWLRCKVYKINFGKAVDQQTEISRSHAYRYVDKALSAIAQGLERDGVPV